MSTFVGSGRGEGVTASDPLIGYQRKRAFEKDFA